MIVPQVNITWLGLVTGYSVYTQITYWMLNTKFQASPTVIYYLILFKGNIHLFCKLNEAKADLYNIQHLLFLLNDQSWYNVIFTALCKCNITSRLIIKWCLMIVMLTDYWSMLALLSLDINWVYLFEKRTDSVIVQCMLRNVN